MKLYSYFRSSASWRVRIALHYKRIPVEIVPIHLLRDGGEQHKPDYRTINPLGTVPLLEVPGNPTLRLGESLGIIEYLEETHPAPPLLLGDAASKARIRWIAEIVNSAIHPLQNLSTLQRLEKNFGADNAAKKAWAAHFIGRGFDAIETLVRETAGVYCFGDDVTLADVCLLPQTFNARRFGVALEGWPTIQGIAERLERHPSFDETQPSKQVDAEGV